MFCIIKYSQDLIHFVIINVHIHLLSMQFCFLSFKKILQRARKTVLWIKVHATGVAWYMSQAKRYHKWKGF